MESASEMTKEKIFAELREPLPIDKNIGEPALSAYLDRLDELFGPDWDQDIQATASGVRCEIEINYMGIYYTKRSAIARSTENAIKECCHLIGIGRY